MGNKDWFINIAGLQSLTPNKAMMEKSRYMIPRSQREDPRLEDFPGKYIEGRSGTIRLKT